ncbi:unnamed protein product [Sphagnum jensenii]|uniref:Uncharacterized protein n=1 Tax=Sphagnum jensenii TaxID=128206 RepID=A0ABP0WVK3_9BRYO
MGHEKVFEQASLKLFTWTWCNMLFTYIKGIVNLGICYQQGEASTLEGQLIHKANHSAVYQIDNLSSTAP